MATKTPAKNIRDMIEQLGIPAPAWLDDLRISKASSARLDELEPLWIQLHRHHIEVADPRRGPVRSEAESWAIKRGWYEAWLEEPDSFLLLAELKGELVGYLLARAVPGDPTPTWIPPERRAEIEALAVHPKVRDLGVGALLSLAVKSEAYQRGFPALGGAIVAGNEDAVRFYQREGAYLKYVSMELRFDPSSPPLEFPFAESEAA